MKNAESAAVLQVAAHLAAQSGTLKLRRPAPNVRAAELHAQRLLRAAAEDDVEALARLVRDRPPDAACLLFLVRLAERAGRSQHQKHAAQSKNAAARAFAVKAYECRADLRESKAAFARRCVMSVKRRFGLTVKPVTIARDWLQEAAMQDPSSEGARAWTGRPFRPAQEDE